MLESYEKRKGTWAYPMVIATRLGKLPSHSEISKNTDRLPKPNPAIRGSGSGTLPLIDKNRSGLNVSGSLYSSGSRSIALYGGTKRASVL